MRRSTPTSIYRLAKAGATGRRVTDARSFRPGLALRRANVTAIAHDTVQLLLSLVEIQSLQADFDGLAVFIPEVALNESTLGS